jgi:hypothetical protein
VDLEEQDKIRDENHKKLLLRKWKRQQQV